MRRKEIEKIMEEHWVFECDIENTFYFVEDVLNAFADEIEKNEPYATNSIRELRNAAMCVSNCSCDVQEVMENDKED